MRVEEITNIRESSEWLKTVKAKAAKTFFSLPVPLEREEDWRYTDLSKTDMSKFTVFSNGHKADGKFVKDLLSEEGRKHLEKLSFANDKFLALHLATLSNGIIVHVPRGETATVNAKNVQHAVVILEPNSTLTYIEEFSSHEGDADIATSYVDVHAMDGARADFYSVQDFAGDVHEFATKRTIVGSNAVVNWVFGAFGGKLARTRILTDFNGEGGSGDITGVFLGDNSQHIDVTTNIVHNVPNTQTKIHVNGVLKDHSSAVHHGLIRIEKAAKNTNAAMNSHSLLLSDNTTANPIPALIIENNDVKASHSASVGQVNEEKMFYLMSRGLSRDEAERLVVTGFLEPVIALIPDEGIRTRVNEMIEKRL